MGRNEVAVAPKPKRGKTDSQRSAGGRGRAGASPFKRKSCLLCKNHVQEVDYKDVTLLRRFISDRAKIRPRRVTGACRRHQRLVALAIKRAREMALLPYVGANDGPPERNRATDRR